MITSSDFTVRFDFTVYSSSASNDISSPDSLSITSINKIETYGLTLTAIKISAKAVRTCWDY